MKKHVPNPIALLALIPIFLIMSSSGHAVISATQNKEIQIISQVMAKEQTDNFAESRYQARTKILTYSDTNPPSPTPTADPGASSTEESSLIRPQNEAEAGKDNRMEVASIASGRAVHTVWTDNTPGNSEIFYKRDGADYDPTTVNLSNNLGVSNQPAIAALGNNVHVVWQENTGGNFDILYRRSFDGGATFGPTINISNNAGGSFNPTIAVSDSNVQVIWEDNTAGNSDILYRRSTNGGESFTEMIKNLSSNAGFSFVPAIAVSGNNVHVVWNDDTPGNDDILYRRSTDGGSTFPNVIKNLSSNAGTSESPKVAVSGANVHVLWRDFTPGNADILYRRSTDGGSTFPNIIKNLSSNAGSSSIPSIAVSGNNVHVVWVDTITGVNDILYRRSTDGGLSFTDPIKNLSSSTGISNSPSISLSSNNVYVVWNDETGLPAGNRDILYRTSSNNGATFPSLLSNLSVNPGSSGGPSVAAS